MSGLRYLLILIFFYNFSFWLSGQSTVEYFFSDQEVCANDTLRLPLRVRDFINVRNFQSSVRWNPDELTFHALEEIHPVLASNFLINTDSTESGGLGYFWLDNSSGNPVALADSSVLFVLKFTMTNGVAATEVGFGDVPTLTETVVEFNGNFMQVNSTQLFGLIENIVTAESVIQAASTGSNGAIDLSVLTGEIPFSFLWNTGATTEDLDNLAPDLYSVTITDALGCSASLEFLVNLNTATQNEFDQYLTITPNPAFDYVNIHFSPNPSNWTYQYKLYNPRGSIIFHKKNISSDLMEKIDLKNQLHGLYFLEIKTEKKRQVFKIIKQ